MSAEGIIMAAGGALITLLLTTVAFFLNRLISQIDGLASAVGHLDKNMALHIQALAALKVQLEASAATVSALKKQVVILKRLYHELQIRYDTLERGIKKFDDWLNKKV